MDQDTDVGNAEVHHLRDLLVRETLLKPQHQHFLLSRGESRDLALKVLTFLG
jgi:hypothetical protein